LPITIPHINAKTSRIIKPVGIVPIFTRLRYHPPAASCGQLTEVDFVKTEARPFAMFMLAIETMNGATDRYETSHPLKSPNRVTYDNTDNQAKPHWNAI
jgi:hypothetical protein